MVAEQDVSAIAWLTQGGHVLDVMVTNVTVYSCEHRVGHVNAFTVHR